MWIRRFLHFSSSHAANFHNTVSLTMSMRFLSTSPFLSLNSSNSDGNLIKPCQCRYNKLQTGDSLELESQVSSFIRFLSFSPYHATLPLSIVWYILVTSSFVVGKINFTCPIVGIKYSRRFIIQRISIFYPFFFFLNLSCLPSSPPKCRPPLPCFRCPLYSFS